MTRLRFDSQDAREGRYLDGELIDQDGRGWEIVEESEDRSEFTAKAPDGTLERFIWTMGDHDAESRES